MKRRVVTTILSAICGVLGVFVALALLWSAGLEEATTTSPTTSSATGQFFADVPSTNQFYTEINWMGTQGISTGWAQPDGTHIYQPLLPVARDAMAAFMYRLAGSPAFTPPASSPFTDVPPTSQFYKPITWLASKGISTGWAEADGTRSYRPLNSVNRDAMAAFMYRLAGSPTFTPPSSSPFLDVPATGQFYKEITWLAANGISTGYPQPDGTKLYAPLNPVNRDAMAAFMYRFYRLTHPVGPGPVTALTAVAASPTEVDLRWTVPADSSYAGVAIRRSTGGTPPATPTDGAAIADLPSPTVSFSDTSATASQTYTYALFAHDSNGHYAAAVSASATTPCAPTAVTVPGTITTSTTWTSACVSEYRVPTTGTTVEAGVKLNVGAGTVVKGGTITVAAGGSLAVNGTAAAPVVSTSIDDTSVGDPASGSGTPAFDSRTAIKVANGSTTTISHADFRYGGISTGSSTNFTGGSLGVDASTFEHIGAGLVFAGDGGYSGTTALTNSSFTDVDTGVIDTTSPLTMTTNAFATNKQAFDIDQDDLTGIPLTGPGSNTLTGSPTARSITIGGTIPAGKAYTLAHTPGAEIDALGFTADPSTSGILVKGTATIPAGTVVKGRETITAAPGGSLNVQGTASSPVIFTSINDTSVGDPASGTGTAAAAGDWVGIRIDSTGTFTADYFTARYAATLIDNAGTTALHHAVLGNATTCVNATAPMSVDGTITDCTSGVNGIQQVDARNVDWGSVDGPAPFGPGVNTSGNVLVVPWVGYTAPVPAATPPPGGWSTSSNTCSPLLVIAVRGSGEAPTGPATVATDPSLYDAFSYAQMIAPPGQEFRGLGSKVQSILTGQTVTSPGVVQKQAQGFLDDIQAADSANARIMPLIYPAASTALLGPGAMISTDSNPIGGVSLYGSGVYVHVSMNNFLDYMSSIQSGIYELEGRLSDAVSMCPNQKIVLAGYSQGAMVIHMTLAHMQANAASISSFNKVLQSGLITNVLLLANPLQDQSHPIGSYLGTGYTQGLITELNALPVVKDVGKALLSGFDLSDPYPSNLQPATISYCTAGDVMCAPMNQYNLDIHTGYTPAQLAVLGAAAATNYYK